MKKHEKHVMPNLFKMVHDVCTDFLFGLIITCVVVTKSFFTSAANATADQTNVSIAHLHRLNQLIESSATKILQLISNP